MSQQAVWAITGASRGIGLEFVRQLLGKDPNAVSAVIATCRSPKTAHELNKLKEDSQNHGRLHIYKLDADDEHSIKEAAKEIGTLFGSGVDYLVNNAGIASERVSTLFETTKDDMIKVFGTNVVGPFLVTKYFRPLLEQRQRRTVINMSSQIGSIETTTVSNYLPYRTSKAALNMVTKVLAVELKSEGYNIVSMHPGWVQTDMGGKGATLKPHESVQAMLDVINKLKPEQSGKLIDYKGKELPY